MGRPVAEVNLAEQQRGTLLTCPWVCDEVRVVSPSRNAVPSGIVCAYRAIRSLIVVPRHLAEVFSGIAVIVVLGDSVG